MGPDLLEGDVELTEFTELDVKSIKGVKQGANGFPVLLMKGLPVAKADAGTGPTHGAFTGTHSHPHAANGAQDGDETHSHEHTHDGDGDHGHTHGTSKGLPAWHSPAALLVRLAAENPGKDRGELFKAVAADGAVDEQPDIDGGMQAIALIGKLIGYEAAELSAGQLDETTDVSILCSAAEALKIWLSRERAGAMVAADEMVMASCGCPPDCACCAGVVMASTGEAEKSSAAINDLPDSAFGYIEPGGSKDDEGKTTPRKLRHFPLHDEKHARLAVQMLSTSPHGDKARPKVMAAAKKYGIETSDGDSKKSAVAEGETGVQTDAQETGSLSKAVEDALAKALGPLKDGLNAVKADLAKVMAAPVPGGPVLSAVRPQAVSGGDDWAAKAALYRQKADVATDPALRDGYRQLAREADEKSQAAPAA